jgi:uncharacterized membrane protein
VEKKMPSSVSFLSPHRIEGLTDGVFAVAMTLLVIGLDVPFLPKGTSAGALAVALLDLALPLFKYVVSFLLLGSFWIIHVRQAQHICRVDLPYLWLGVGALILIALVPFSTSLVADYPDMGPAEYFFHLNILGISTLYAAQWVHATRHHRLVEPDLQSGMLEKEMRLGLLIPAFAIMGLMLAAEGPFESNLLYAAVPPLAALLRRFS